MNISPRPVWIVHIMVIHTCIHMDTNFGSKELNSRSGRGRISLSPSVFHPERLSWAGRALETQIIIIIITLLMIRNARVIRDVPPAGFRCRNARVIRDVPPAGSRCRNAHVSRDVPPAGTRCRNARVIRDVPPAGSRCGRRTVLFLNGTACC